MRDYLRKAARDGQAVLAILIAYVAVAIKARTPWYFLLGYLSLCGCVIRTALKR